MPYRKPNYTYANVGIHKESEALEDLDELAEAFGLTRRADALRMLAVAYSRAKRGKWQPLWAFVNGLNLPAHLLLANGMQLTPTTTPPEESQQEDQAQQEAAKKRKKNLTKFYQKNQ